MIISALQIGGDILANNPLGFLIFYIPFLLFIFYGQKIQAWMILGDVSRSVSKLQFMKDKARKETIEHLKTTLKPSKDPTERIDQFLEYFTIMPVDLDPNGIVKKIDHLMNVRNDRVRNEIKNLATVQDPVQTSVAENVLEVSSSLNFLYKVVRHYYLLGKKTKSFFILVQVQMIMPIIMEMANALASAMGALKNIQPLGDGVGPMVVGKLMTEHPKVTVAKDTVMGESEYNGRKLFILKAEGPGGMVGEVGTAIEKLVKDMKVSPTAVVMIDAALKLEGEKSGDVAEGIGAAIGGIGVDRFKIEEVASASSIPLYAVVIKQSLVDAISTMRKEIAEAADKVINVVYRVIDEKTKPGDTLIIVGVGNTLGVGQ
ncbi:MAG: DUF1512 domain-containing protein [Thaumarchaeota archaeon]|nr:DUF1512 domain-containing protein [Nitrososphaerota archaeon]